jgi:hypothetical protein
MNTADEDLKGIGSITLEFAHLEWLLDNLLAGLNCDFKSKDAEPADYDSVSKRLKLIWFRIEKKYPSRLTEWNNLERDIRNLAKERERVLHAASVREDSPNVFIRIAKSEPMPDLADLSARAASAGRRLTDFLASLI